jgi:PhnB protein
MSLGSPPAGFHSVTPRIVVPDVRAAVNFLREVFAASGDIEPDRPAQLRIGDSLVMISQAGVRELFPAFLYVYVDDVETAFCTAIDLGAEVLESPQDTPYGDRRAMIRDPFGNVFQIAQPLSAP